MKLIAILAVLIAGYSLYVLVTHAFDLPKPPAIELQAR